MADFLMALMIVFLGDDSETVNVLPPPTTNNGDVISSPGFVDDIKSTSVTSLTDLAERTAALPTVTLNWKIQFCLIVNINHVNTCGNGNVHVLTASPQKCCGYVIYHHVLTHRKRCNMAAITHANIVPSKLLLYTTV